MRIAKRVFLGLLGLFAWSMIGISGEMLQVPRERFTSGDFAYPVLLLVSVVYVHWLFRVFLMPLSHLERDQRHVLKQQALAQYSKGFLAGTVGLGYLLVAVYIVGFYSDFRDQASNLVWPGVFFVALGTLAQVRGLVRFLTGDSVKGSGCMATNGSQPARSDTNQTSQAADSHR